MMWSGLMIVRNPVAIQFYLSKSDKAAFLAACRASDTTMSREFRRFVRWFIQNAPGDDRIYHQPFTRMDGRAP